MSSPDDMIEKKYTHLNNEMIFMMQAFDRFFSGKDSVPPVVKLKKYKSKIKNLTQEKIRDNSLKFKITNLYNKLLTYEAAWNKKLYLIEVGLTSTGKKRKSKKEKRYLRHALEDQLYADFIESQKKVSGKLVDKDEFIRNIYKQKKKLEKDNKVDDVWFKVVHKDGKTTIKAFRKEA